MWGQPLSGSLWLALLLSLAPSCSLLLSQAPYCSPNLRTTSSLGSQGPCSARSGAAALQHFMLLCPRYIVLCINILSCKSLALLGSKGSAMPIISFIVASSVQVQNIKTDADSNHFFFFFLALFQFLNRERNCWGLCQRRNHKYNQLYNPNHCHKLCLWRPSIIWLSPWSGFIHREQI